MSRRNNKLILAFGIITFILGLFLASSAYAAGGMVNSGVIFTPIDYPTQYQYNYYPQYMPVVYTTPIYNSPTVIDGCNGRNTGFSTTTGQSCIGNYVPTPVPATAAPATTEKTTTTTSDTKDTYSGLAANALFGSNGFMPSGLVQWVFFIALVVAIVYLWRYVYAEEKYRSEPMKHA